MIYFVFSSWLHVQMFSWFFFYCVDLNKVNMLVLVLQAVPFIKSCIQLNMQVNTVLKCQKSRITAMCWVLDQKCVFNFPHCCCPADAAVQRWHPECCILGNSKNAVCALSDCLNRGWANFWTVYGTMGCKIIYSGAGADGCSEKINEGIFLSIVFEAAQYWSLYWNKSTI